MEAVNLSEESMKGLVSDSSSYRNILIVFSSSVCRRNEMSTCGFQKCRRLDVVIGEEHGTLSIEKNNLSNRSNKIFYLQVFLKRVTDFFT
jgi:hypothetical protein